MASHDTLKKLFDRMCLYLQRLQRYIKIQLTKDLTTLLGNIMAQLLSILALSAKAMTEWRISKMMASLCPYFVDHTSEHIAKRLIGREDVEDALSQLESLTKEENLAVVSRSLECTQHLPTVFIHLLTLILYRILDSTIRKQTFVTLWTTQCRPSGLTHTLRE
jgi:hypothetical protein